MKKTLVYISLIIVSITYGQKTVIQQIETAVKKINADTTLTKTVFDWTELENISTDGGGLLTVWRDGDKIFKIVENIGLSRGQFTTTIYLNSNEPIKIIEKEALFVFENNELNYAKLETNFTAVIHITNWKKNNSRIMRKGTRAISKRSFDTEDYQPIIDRAKKAIKL